jgi:Subtilase family.
MSERKVVRYRNSATGDKVDGYQGHGTRVAGIIAGKLASNVEDKADGVAPDAKLHMWDIQKGNGEFEK